GHQEDRPPGFGLLVGVGQVRVASGGGGWEDGGDDVGGVALVGVGGELLLRVGRGGQDGRGRRLRDGVEHLGAGDLGRVDDVEGLGGALVGGGEAVPAVGGGRREVDLDGVSPAGHPGDE